MEVVASRHSGCIVEVVGSDIAVLVFVEGRKLVVLSRRVVEQGRSLLGSSSWSGEKRFAGQQELRQQTGLAELENDVRWGVREAEEWLHTRDL